MNIQMRVQLSQGELQSRLEAGEQLEAEKQKREQDPLLIKPENMKDATALLDPKEQVEFERLLAQKMESRSASLKEAVQLPDYQSMSRHQWHELVRKQRRY